MTRRRPTPPANRREPGATAHVNLIGPCIIRLRSQRGWTQDQLVAKLQVVGCPITRDILANIELRRTVAKDMYVQALAIVFDVSMDWVFPPRDQYSRRVIGVEFRTRRRRKDRRHRTRKRLQDKRQTTRRTRRR